MSAPVSIIVACDPHGVIGIANKLPWRCKEDLQIFRKRTLGHAVVMGRKTWDSIPKKPLDGRANVIVSRTVWATEAEKSIFYYGTLEGSLRAVRDAGKEDDVYGVSLNSAKLAEYADKEIFIIGGAQIYKEAIERNLVDRIIMSKMHNLYDGDVYFPILDDNKWTVEETEEHDGFDVSYIIKAEYVR